LIRLGYEIDTGRAVDIPLRHLAVTGQTQESGKTTTLEALITRSELRAVAFVTKRGEKSFRLMNPIPPYFREPANTAETPMWFWVKSILEATQGMKLRMEEAAIINASGSAKSLEDVHQNVRELAKKAKRGFERDICTCLDAYFNRVMPQIKKIRASKSLSLSPGVNVMDLGDYSEPVQALIIRSVLEEVYLHGKNTIVIVPEAWKFIPLRRGSPVRLAAEAFIRQGAALKNYIWIDSQDLANVATEVLKSISVWILGVQRELNEVKRTLGYIGIGAAVRAEEIQRLGKGQFYVCFGDTVKKVYVQPAGMDDVHAHAIACGDESPDSWRQIVRSLDKKLGTAVASEADAVQVQVEEPPDEGQDEEAEREANQLNTGRPDIPDGSGNHGGSLAEGENASLRIGSRTTQDTEGQAASLRNNQRAPKAETIPEKVVITDFAECVYQQLKRRLLGEAQVIALLTAKPEIKLHVERPTIEMNSAEPRGRIALLISEGFFSREKSIPSTVEEFRRRGWMAATGRPIPLNLHFSKLCELGFLTLEAAGYRAVEGMKVNIT
jgi:hypothetical protein